MSLRRRALFALGLALAACPTAGCDSRPHYEHATVHGKVTYNGKPVTFGSVLFIPIEPPKDGTMQPASGTINPDGTYELKSQADRGAMLGEHKVLVIAVEGDKPVVPSADEKVKTGAPGPSKSAGSVQFKSAVPKKYSDPAGTPLTRKVVAGDNTINIDLAD